MKTALSPPVNILLTVLRQCFLYGSFVLVILHVSVCSVCFDVVSVSCSLVVTYWDRAELLALVCGVELLVWHFPIGILDQVCYLIVLIPDPCTLTYLQKMATFKQFAKKMQVLINFEEEPQNLNRNKTSERQVKSGTSSLFLFKIIAKL